MGTCQSRAPDSAVIPARLDNAGLKAHNAKTGARSRPLAAFPKGGDGGMTLMFPNKASKLATLVSPSERTAATIPETPTYQLTSPDSNFSFVSPMPESLSDDLPPASENSTTEAPSFDSASSVSFDNPSLNRSVLESIITGGLNEDDAFLPATFSIDGISTNSLQHLGSKPVKKRNQEERYLISMPPGRGVASASPARCAKAKNRAEEAARLHLMHGRVTTPESIVFRPAPLIAPPKGSICNGPPAVVDKSNKLKTSVNPQTIANFNRLKIQVQLAEKHAMHRRRKAKLEDRFEDVKGYRNLWKDFESLQTQVDQKKTPENERPGILSTKTKKSMDLKEPQSWFFDFQALNRKIHLDDDEANSVSRSQSSMSLLSEATMEVQRKFYHEKRRERRKCQQRGPKDFPSSKDKKLKKRRSSLSDDRSMASARSTTSRGSAAYLRGITNLHGGDYGPTKESDVSGVDMSCDLDSDDSTPRTRTGRTHADDMSRTTYPDEGNSVISDLDVDNDYNVPRRRRPCCYVADDSSLDTFDDNKSIEELGLSKIELDMNGFQPRIRGKSGSMIDAQNNRLRLNSATRERDGKPPLPTSKASKANSARSLAYSRIEMYGFDPAAPLSSQLDIFASTVPSLQIEDAKKGIVRWREYSCADTKTVTARRLDGVFGGENQTESDSAERESEYSMPGVDPLVFRNYTGVHAMSSSKAAKQKILARASKAINLRHEHYAESGSSTYDPYDMMSSSHFLLMSSCHGRPSSEGQGEHSDAQQKEDKRASDIPSEITTAAISTVAMQNNRKERKQVARPVLKTYDPLISNLSTEAFLRMSSWQPPDRTMGINDHDWDASTSPAKDYITDIEIIYDDTLSGEESTSTIRNNRSQKETWQQTSTCGSKPSSNGEDHQDIASQVANDVDALLGKFLSDASTGGGK